VTKQSFAIPLVTSLTIHGLVLIIASSIIHNNLQRPDYLPVSLIELSVARKTDSIAEIDKPTSTPTQQLPESKPAMKSEVTHVDQPTAPFAKEEVTKPVESKLSVPVKTETPAIASTARIEGGSSAAGAGNLFGRSDVGVVPGGGGGTAASGLGRGSGAPGLPAQQTILRTNREAKPIQTVRATYPPMALRMGMEADVTLRILVDPEGNVTKAEITKSGGAGFDDEALKAVKQSRFEPAQKDGQNIPAEFTYIYRFRLQR
jgi:TonB family protein